MNFLLENKELLLNGGLVLIGMILGFILPNAKCHLFGKKIGQKIPRKLALVIADKIDAVEKGLRNQSYNGDKNISSNEQVSKSINNLKVDLGL